MKRGTTKKTNHLYTGIRWPVCPERFPHPAGRILFARSLAIPTDYHYRNPCHYNLLAHLQTQARQHGKMVITQERSGQ